MDRWKGRVALVTGASAGIGACVAASLVKQGLTVVGCGRNVQRIQDLASQLSKEEGKLIAVQCDLCKESDIIAMFERIRSEVGRLDVCINNAGLGKEASILDGDMKDWREMMEVNVLAVCLCTREAVKIMREKSINDGHIININSMSGHRIVPGRGDEHMYAASKFSLTAITEGTRQELRFLKSQIRVTQVSPGMVATEFRQRMFGDEEKAAKERESLDTILTSDDIAECVLFAIKSPPHMQVHDILVRPTTQTF